MNFQLSEFCISLGAYQFSKCQELLKGLKEAGKYGKIITFDQFYLELTLSRLSVESIEDEDLKNYAGVKKDMMIM